MRVGILGSGGREATLAWKLAEELGHENVFVLPGNAHIKNSYALDPCDFPALKNFCMAKGIDCLLPGGEQTIAAGIADYFQDSNIFVVAPMLKAAHLETSKAFAKSFMRAYGVETAGAIDFPNLQAAQDYLSEEFPEDGVVIKYDGLAAGKGVFVCENIAEAAEAFTTLTGMFGINARILLEERLTGVEFSLIALLDGSHIELLPTAQDHKRLCDNNTGPNTGGMGAICPVPWVSKQILAETIQKIVTPTMYGLQKEGIKYRGFLYFGIMYTQNGPKLLEYNVRLGDPETQVIIPSLSTPLADLLFAVKTQKLSENKIGWNQRYFTGVVFANKGYPTTKQQSVPIIGLESLARNTLLFYANVEKREKELFSGSGRNFCLVNSGTTLPKAIAATYAECAKIFCPDLHFRKDIGRYAYPANRHHVFRTRQQSRSPTREGETGIF